MNVNELYEVQCYSCSVSFELYEQLLTRAKNDLTEECVICVTFWTVYWMQIVRLLTHDQLWSIYHHKHWMTPAKCFPATRTQMHVALDGILLFIGGFLFNSPHLALQTAKWLFKRSDSVVKGLCLADGSMILHAKYMVCQKSATYLILTREALFFFRFPSARPLILRGSKMATFFFWTGDCVGWCACI